MADAALKLVDRVFPRGVPVRQWVLSVPKLVRWHIARKPRLRRRVARIFFSEVRAELRGRAPAGRPRSGRAWIRTAAGAVTVSQRFGGALNLNVHLHSLAMDGVYVRDADTGSLRFLEAVSAPPVEALQALVGRVEARVLDLCERDGIRVRRRAEEEQDPEGDDPEQLDLFDELQAASIRELVGLSPDGEVRRVRMLGKEGEGDPAWDDAEEGRVEDQKAEAGHPRPLAAHSNGFSVHAGVRIEGHDREGLRRLCRYVMRPPFAEDRFERLPGPGSGSGSGSGGQVSYRLRRPRRDGTTHLALTPLELLEKLAALVPKHRDHDVHYQGVLAPNARWRGEVVAGTPCAEAAERTGPCAASAQRRGAAGERAGAPKPPGRLPEGASGVRPNVGGKRAESESESGFGSGPSEPMRGGSNDERRGPAAGSTPSPARTGRRCCGGRSGRRCCGVRGAGPRGAAGWR
jgi:hypothetical protein